MAVIITKAKKALLESVVAKLQADLGNNSPLKYLQNRYIEIGVDERVAPASADKSISVYLSTLSVESQGPSRREEYLLSVAFTSRKKAIPSDMRGTALLTDSFENRIISIEEVVEAIIESLDGKLDVITNANERLAPDSANYVTMPLYLTPNTELKPEEVGADHFYTQPSQRGRDRQVENLEGYKVEIPFSGATRYVNTLGE